MFLTNLTLKPKEICLPPCVLFSVAHKREPNVGNETKGGETIRDGDSISEPAFDIGETAVDVGVRPRAFVPERIFLRRHLHPIVHSIKFFSASFPT